MWPLFALYVSILLVTSEYNSVDILLWKVLVWMFPHLTWVQGKKKWAGWQTPLQWHLVLVTWTHTPVSLVNQSAKEVFMEEFQQLEGWVNIETGFQSGVGLLELVFHQSCSMYRLYFYVLSLGLCYRLPGPLPNIDKNCVWLHFKYWCADVFWCS